VAADAVAVAAPIRVRRRARPRTWLRVVYLLSLALIAEDLAVGGARTSVVFTVIESSILVGTAVWIAGCLIRVRKGPCQNTFVVAGAYALLGERGFDRAVRPTSSQRPRGREIWVEPRLFPRRLLGVSRPARRVARRRGAQARAPGRPPADPEPPLALQQFSLARARKTAYARAQHVPKIERAA
jgi:hypothetical protein